MKKFRLIWNEEKKMYSVQGRWFLFFWIDLGLWFTSFSDARACVNDANNKLDIWW